MGRGDPRRYSHLKLFTQASRYFIDILTDVQLVDPDSLPSQNFAGKLKRYGRLVLLGFDITAFRPVAYQRGRLPRPL